MASGHPVLYNSDDRGTMMWVGLIWAIRMFGPGFYLAFEISRIKQDDQTFAASRQSIFCD